MRNRSKRRRHEKKSDRKSALVTTRDPKSLFENRDYARAAHVLREQIAIEPTDERKRLLCDCLIELGKHQEAGEALLAIENQSAMDLAIAGWCFCQLDEWDNAIQKLEASLQISQDSETYFWLAVAHAQNRLAYLITDESTRTLIASYLEKAIALPNCPANAFVFLSDLRQDEKDKVLVLEAGLASNPDSESIRLHLAPRYIYGVGDHQQGIDVLTPLLADDIAPVQALWDAAVAFDQTRNFAKALNLVERIHANSKDDEMILAAKKGDLLLKLGELEKALGEYDKLVKEGSVVFQIIGLFSRAWARFESGEVQRCVEDTDIGMDLWFGGADPSVPDVFPTINGEFINYDMAECFERVCEALLGTAECGKYLSSSQKGRLGYLLFERRITRRDIVSNEERREQTYRLLLEASRLVDHPIMSSALHSYYVDARNWALAAKHHLTYWLWQFSVWDRTEDFPDDLVGMFHYRPLTFEEQDRVQIHKAALECLVSCDNDEAVHYVILPFYRFFWRDLLFDGKMYQEISDATITLLNRLPDSEDELFDCAYSLHQLRRYPEAEDVYRRYLQKQPEDSSALHNLSLVLESLGEIAEALDLSARAGTLAPDDEMIVRRREELKRKVEQTREATSQADELFRMAPAKWHELDFYKKKLLVALTGIERFDDFDHLSKLSGIGIQYLPGHWRKLVSLGMIIENDDETWHVNEHILSLIRQERSPAIVSKFVSAGKTAAFKPVFNSGLEYTVYNLLLGIYPNYLVFPNMAVQTIFQYDRMKDLLKPAEFKHFLMSQVDFCITSTTDYMPIIAFEVDSDYHDAQGQADKDELKDNIFHLGGVPLVRLRVFGQPAEQELRRQIIEAIRSVERSAVYGTNTEGLRVSF